MAKDKVISRDAFAWGHFGTILFHVAIAILLIVSYFVKNWDRDTLRIINVSVGSVLLAVSILALVPIFRWYDSTKRIVIDRS